MIASRILGALVVASVASCALAAGIYRAETKAGSVELADSRYASPALVGARKSAESKLKAEKPLERLEQVKQEPASQVKEDYHEQSAYKQEEYREEPAPAPAAAPAKSAPLASKGERKVLAPTKQQAAPLIKYEEQRKEEAQKEYREEQKEYKQVEQKEYKQEQKIEAYEQKRLQQHPELEAEPGYVRYDDQQQQLQLQEEQVRETSASYAAPPEAKGPRKQAASLVALEQVRQQQEELLSREAPFAAAPSEAKGGRKQPSYAGLEQVRQQQEEALQQPAGEPEPYQFSYQIDGSSRSEQGDTKGVVRGQYTVQGADGASRVVDYVADHNGFRASVQTNEFGTEQKSPASVQLRTSQPLAEEISIRLDQQQSKVATRRLEPSKGGKTSEAHREGPHYQAKGYVAPQQPQEPAKEATYLAKGQLAELRSPAESRSPADTGRARPAGPAEIGAVALGDFRRYPQTRSSLFESATAH